MNNRLIFKSIFFAFLIQFNIQLLPSTGITLFSISYKSDDNCAEDSFWKVKVLYNSVYDEKALKEEAEKINLLKEEISKNNQKIKEIKQEIEQAKQKEIEIEQLTRKIEEDIKIKKTALQKILS